MFPRELKDNVYAKFYGANKVYYGRCANGQLKSTCYHLDQMSRPLPSISPYTHPSSRSGCHVPPPAIVSGAIVCFLFYFVLLFFKFNLRLLKSFLELSSSIVFIFSVWLAELDFCCKYIHFKFKEAMNRKRCQIKSILLYNSSVGRNIKVENIDIDCAHCTSCAMLKSWFFEVYARGFRSFLSIQWKIKWDILAISLGSTN